MKNQKSVVDVTFRQSSGKWLICNQTGEKISRSKIKGVRIAIDRRLNGYQKPVKEKQLEVQKISSGFLTTRFSRTFSEASCPYCRRVNHNIYYPQKIHCWCGKNFEAV